MDSGQVYCDGSQSQVSDVQQVEASLKAAIMACLIGGESPCWTFDKLAERLHHIGVSVAEATLLESVLELEVELDSTPWAPWRLAKRDGAWMLEPKNQVFDLLLGVRAVPVETDASPLSDEDKAVLLVVLSYRRRGGVSKARIAEVLRLDPTDALERLRAEHLIRPEPVDERVHWTPQEEALLRLGYRTCAEIAALQPFEEWLEVQEQVPGTRVDPAFERSQRVYRRWLKRESERRASTARGQAPFGPNQD
jgi:hypothetical protein